VSCIAFCIKQSYRQLIYNCVEIVKLFVKKLYNNYLRKCIPCATIGEVVWELSTVALKWWGFCEANKNPAQWPGLWVQHVITKSAWRWYKAVPQ
jgi:hypothetical protein